MSVLGRQGAVPLHLLPGMILVVFVAWVGLGQPAFIRQPLLMIEIAEVMKQTQALIDELQNERGRAAQFVSTGDARYREALESQWRSTDFRRAALLGAARNLASLQADGFHMRVGGLNASIDRLRSEVAGRNRTAMALVDDYSTIIATIQTAVVDLPQDTSLTLRLAAYWDLARIKEALGRQRGVGSIGFLEGRFAFPLLATLLEHRGQHDAFVESFLSHADEELRKLYQDEVGQSNGKLETYFDDAVASANAGTPLSTDPDGWFTVLTERIGKLRRVEERVVADIDRFAQDHLRDTIVTLVAAVIGVIIFQLLILARLFRSESVAQVAQKRLARVIENISEGFALWDNSDRLVLSNHRFRDMCQAAASRPVDPYLRPGTHFTELVRATAEGRPEAAEERERWIDGRVATHREPNGGPQEIQFSDALWVRVSEHRSEDGATVGVYSDITEMKRREEILREARYAADLANRAKTEFLANMSHEFRTPLNAIIGFSEIMRDGLMGPLDNPHYRRYAADIREAGQRLLQLVEDVLDMARMETGNVGLREEEVEVFAAVNSALTVVRERAAQRSIRIAVQFDPCLPALRADPGRLKQAFVNILSNAVKFTPDQGAVAVTAECDAAGGIRVSISDNGIGIAPEIVAKVLAPFGQADGGLARRFDGAGLGLPLSKGIMDLHQGTLEIDGREGKGTIVTLRFPPERSVATAAPEAEPAAAST